MATYSSNITQKVAPADYSKSYVSGAVNDDVVATTSANEYLEINSLAHVNNGNGPVFKVKSINTGKIVYQLGAPNTVFPDFTANKKGDCIFVPPNHQLLYSNNVVTNSTIKISGLKTINTP